MTFSSFKRDELISLTFIKHLPQNQICPFFGWLLRLLFRARSIQSTTTCKLPFLSVETASPKPNHTKSTFQNILFAAQKFNWPIKSYLSREQRSCAW